MFAKGGRQKGIRDVQRDLYRSFDRCRVYHVKQGGYNQVAYGPRDPTLPNLSNPHLFKH